MKKYKVIKELKERAWCVGDIVSMDARSAEKVKEYVSEYTGDAPHKHTAITVDSIPLSGVVKLPTNI